MKAIVENILGICLKSFLLFIGAFVLLAAIDQYVFNVLNPDSVDVGAYIIRVPFVVALSILTVCVHHAYHVQGKFGAGRLSFTGSVILLVLQAIIIAIALLCGNYYGKPFEVFMQNASIFSYLILWALGMAIIGFMMVQMHYEEEQQQTPES